MNLDSGRTSSKRSVNMAAATCVGLSVMAISDPAIAIPSPELVVGSISGISQLAALASALLGGGAMAVGARVRRTGRGRGNRVQPKNRWQRFAWPVLLLVGMASLITNLYLVLEQKEAERSRLEATLLRATPKTASGRTLDVALKEKSFTGQEGDPRGITTDAAAKLLKYVGAREKSDAIFLDIRETAELEMGTLPTATAVRFPDLKATDLNLTGKTVVLFCHNGNRSSETCARLAKLGIDCRFIIGGLEKWLVDGRKLSGSGARSLQKLRALPSYPNQTVLLNTKTVQRLVVEDNAVFIDVRYPGEFATGHLPGAINLPIRPTPAPALEKMLAALPKKPIIAPCYDRRSCFYAEILGLMATRQGRDFRGRYTQPWSFAKPRKPPPHVIAWQMKAQQSAWSNFWMKGKQLLATALLQVSNHTGFLAALALLALLSRMLVLSFAVKADRDSQVARTLTPEITQLKVRLKDEPRRRGRAIQMLYKRHNLTPVRNLMALAFLPVLALCVEAVAEVSNKLPTNFLWLSNLSQPDPYYILAIVFAGLLGGYLDQVIARKMWHRFIVWGIVAPLLGLTVAWLSAAAGIYLIVSAVLLIAQRILFFTDFSSLRQPLRLWRRFIGSFRKGHSGIVSLEDSANLKDAGNKALRLSVLKQAGIVVPPGIVLTHNFLSEYAQRCDEWRKKIRRSLWRQLRARKIAVRSSAMGEDGAATSFAGVFETVLDVEANTFENAITHVMGAYHDTRGVLHKLRADGVQIALDDFGTGYASLSYLCSFPFDKIKIDQSFIRDSGDNSQSVAIVRAVADLAQTLDMKTVAEGVETGSHLAKVMDAGCDEVQGYLFSKPVTGNEIQETISGCHRHLHIAA